MTNVWCAVVRGGFNGIMEVWRTVPDPVSIELAEILIEAGTEIGQESTKNRDYALLRWACKFTDFALLRFLLRNGIDS